MDNTYMRLDLLCTTKHGDIELVRNRKTGLLSVKKTVPGCLFPQYNRIRRIYHRNLVRVYEAEREQEKCTIIEEYVDGETLGELLIREGRLEWKQAAKYLHDLCQAVCTLHKYDVVHRDINPNNIMITRDGILKLCDYHISQVSGQSCAAEWNYVGTVGYAPPEQYGYGMTDVQSDIYAMGMTVNKMLMGQTAGWYWKEERVSGNGNGQKIDENKAMLKQILSQMVSLDKIDRYETAAMVLEDLDFLLYDDEKEWGSLSFFSPSFRRAAYRVRPVAAGFLYFVLCCVQFYVLRTGGCDGPGGGILCILSWLLFFDLFRISRRIFRLAAGQRWFRYVIGLIFLLAAPLLEGKVL